MTLFTTSLWLWAVVALAFGTGLLEFWLLRRIGAALRHQHPALLEAFHAKAQTDEQQIDNLARQGRLPQGDRELQDLVKWLGPARIASRVGVAVFIAMILLALLGEPITSTLLELRSRF